MKKWALAGLLLLLTRAALAAEQAVPPPDINTYLHPSRQQRGMSDTVYQMLTEAGRTLGFRGGKTQ